ncbi:zinc carboxypeptidase-like [Danaus plexippus]|uniref:zinc carboxypeptidase-like n=1 Tax=Danaus plexippus TaxID=13037 RepID=UPI002AB1ED7F|nr:zinc carboxypeptidase-like [Danaus plexippus]
MKVIVLCIVLVTPLVVAQQRSYEGYSVYKLTPKTEDDVEVVKRLQLVGEFWEDQFYIDYQLRIMVPAYNKIRFLDIVKESKMEVIEIITDLQQTIEEQLRPAARSLRSDETYLSMNWNQYHNLEDTYKWLDEVQRNNPSVVTTVVMGRSVEGREIKGLKINFRNKTNPVIGFLTGTLHTREWITPSTLTWIIKEFLTSNNRDIRALAENIEWHIFPIVNPDGYVYTFTTNRMWRKNRSRFDSKSCSHMNASDDMSNGVDLNRNFDFVWMGSGSSNDSCAITYAGPTAFSEPETRAISNYALRLNAKGQLLYYIDFHSYTQLILVPYSHLPESEVHTVENYDDMYKVALSAADKIRERNGTVYRAGISSVVMYPMTGTSFDWVKNNTKVSFSFLIELRDLGQYGFLLPAEQIIPNSLETMDGLIEMDKTVQLLGYYSSGPSNFTPSLGIILCAFVLIY